MADKDLVQFPEGETECEIHTADDDYIHSQAYHMTSTPKSNMHHRQIRQNVNCIQQLRSPSHETDFQQGIESISEEQRSFAGQRLKCVGDRMEGEHNFTRTSLGCNQSGGSLDKQQLLKTFQVKPPKEKKSISTKTFAHGLMDVSLLTTHATQLRTVMSNKDHEFYDALVWMICLSIGLQVLSGIFLLTSDFFKTQDKMKDRQNQKKRKVLSFLSLIIVAVNTPLKIIISAFYISNEQHSQKQNLPSFAPSSFSFHNHTEL